MKKVVFAALAAVVLASCGGEKEEEKSKEKELTFCDCSKLMEEREAEVSAAEDREAAIEKWRAKTKKCNEIAMKATQDGTYDEQQAECE